MNEPKLASMESSHTANGLDAPSCPMQAMQVSPPVLEADDELVFPQLKRVVIQYATDVSGAPELHLYYGEKEIVFDEPELFAFGEGLAKQSRFIAKTAVTWGEGYDWPRVRDLLAQLLNEGILRHVSASTSEDGSLHGVRPAPLPPAQTTVARTWFECEAITRELVGRPLELGYLELIIPVHRVAHIALDAEGCQVGEANVFPMPLRLDVPTEWRTCPYTGSRYQDDLPMNVTALRSMTKYWKPTMVALLRIREAYLHRFPRAQHGWTIGDLHRLSSLVLTVPASVVENGVYDHLRL